MLISGHEIRKRAPVQIPEDPFLVGGFLKKVSLPKAAKVVKRTPKILPLPVGDLRLSKKGCISGAKFYALLAKKIFSGTVAVPVLLKLALHAKLCPTIPIRILKFIIG